METDRAKEILKALAAAYGRTTGAITSRLEKLGLIENPHRTGFFHRSPSGAPPSPLAHTPTSAPDNAGDCPF
jgi:hypothetical protein